MNGRSYYNEHDPYAAQWLRNLIDAGHIAPGDVDERSIVDVRADDLRGYTQCHFFAGIGGWSIALRLVGWPDDGPVWTGSCPCQPFSAVGAGKAADDERHLWPAWFPLIAECKPPVVFGEQVEAAIGWGWLDAVFSDLEGEGYACGAAVLPACSVGAPHIRQRLWFVANSSSSREERSAASPRQRLFNDDGRGEVVIMADAAGGGQREFGDALGPRSGRYHDGGFLACELADPERSQWRARRICGPGCSPEALCEWPSEKFAGSGLSGELGNAEHGGCEGRHAERRWSGAALPSGPLNDFWSDAEWIPCTDGKARPVGPGSFPLGHGIPNRASKLRAYGNAINPQTAAEFIAAATDQQ